MINTQPYPPAVAVPPVDPPTLFDTLEPAAAEPYPAETPDPMPDEFLNPVVCVFVAPTEVDVDEVEGEDDDDDDVLESVR